MPTTPRSKSSAERCAGRLLTGSGVRPRRWTPIPLTTRSTHMGRYVLRRLLQLIPVFAGTTFLIYALVWVLPGDPFSGKCGQRACPQAYVDMMTAKYNLNDSLVVQYFKYLGKLFTGDFGETFSGNSIGQMMADSAPITLRLPVLAV